MTLLKSVPTACYNISTSKGGEGENGISIPTGESFTLQVDGWDGYNHLINKKDLLCVGDQKERD